mmetsp:Transcript_13169/g.25544  ORF Transcript_13169/g.25544 Transcript_13169/m.25544 type:complete len:3141 (-) Transcript_13169:26-9448(-)
MGRAFCFRLLLLVVLVSYTQQQQPPNSDRTVDVESEPATPNTATSAVKRKRCNGPPKQKRINGAFGPCKRVKHGKLCLLKCKPGFIKKGKHARCRNGRYTKAPRCVPKQRPGSIQNSSQWWKRLPGFSSETPMEDNLLREGGSTAPFFAYRGGFLTFAHSAALATGVELYWTISGTVLTAGLVGPADAWIGVGFSPDGKMVGSDAVVGWSDEQETNVQLRDYHLGGKSPSLVNVVGNGKQKLIAFDATQIEDRGVKSTAILFQRELLVAGAVPVHTHGPTNIIYAYGSIPPSSNEPLTKHIAKGSVKVCFDGSGCPDPPVLLSPLGTHKAQGLADYTFYFAPYFASPQNEDTLTFDVVGLPLNTGLSVSADGSLNGRPSLADIYASPLQLTAVATADRSRLNVTANFTLLVQEVQCGDHAGNCYSCVNLGCNFLEGGACQHDCDSSSSNIGKQCIKLTSVCPLPPLLASAVPPQQAKRGLAFEYSLAKHFANVTVNALTYSVDGLPAATALFVNTQTGVMSGSPSAADLASSPLAPIVSATDSFGQKVSYTFTLVVLEAGACVTDKQCGSGTYCRLQQCVQYVKLAQSCSKSGVRCAAGLFCKVQYNDVGTCQPVKCLESTTCSSCLSSNCYWSDGLCREACPLQSGSTSWKPCFSPGASCPPNQTPSLVSPLKDLVAVANTAFSLAAASAFADSDSSALRFAVKGLPLGSGLKLDTSSGVLSGQANGVDVSNNPLSLTISAFDPEGLSVSSSFTLIVDGQCSSKASCGSCVSGGCKWLGNFCAQQCYGAGPGSACVYDTLMCPGQKLGEVCTPAKPCIPDLQCSNTDFGICQSKVDCSAQTDCRECSSKGCRWSLGRCGNTCDSLAKLCVYNPATCPLVYHAAAEFDSAAVSGMAVLNTAVSDQASTSIRLDLRTLNTGLSGAYNLSWGIYNNPSTSTCQGIGQLFNPSAVQSGANGYTSRCQADRSHSQCVVGDLTTKFGTLLVPSGERHYEDMKIRLLGVNSVIGRSVGLFRTVNGVQAEVVACATIRLLDSGKPVLFAPVPDQHLLPDRSMALDVSRFFFDPDGDALTFSIAGLPASSGLRLDSNSGMLEGKPSSSDLSLGGLTATVTASDTRQLASHTFTIRFDGECAADSECRDGFCSAAKCVPWRTKGQACGTDSSKCAPTLKCSSSSTTSSGGSRQCVGAPCSAQTCAALGGYCHNAECVPYVWFGEVCTAGKSVCSPGLTCRVYYANTGRCEAVGPTLPETTAVEGTSISFDFGSYLNASTSPSVFVLSGHPIGTGLRLDTSSGVLTGMLTRGDAAAKQPILLTVTGTSSTTGVVVSATLAVNVLPMGSCAVASSCAQCGLRNCRWNPQTRTCSAKCSLTGSECYHGANCPAVPCAEDTQCYQGFCSQGFCFSYKGAGQNCDQANHRCGEGLTCLAGVCSVDGFDGKIHTPIFGKVDSPFFFNVSSILQAPNPGKTTFAVSAIPNRPGSGVKLGDSSFGILTGLFNHLDALEPQPQHLKVTATDSLGQSRSATLLVFVSSTQECSTATTCQDCTRLHCNWMLDRCVANCPAGVACFSRPTQCPACYANVTSGSVCAAKQYCSGGLCYPLQKLGQVCNDDVRCSDGLDCNFESKASGLCHRKESCSTSPTCGACALRGCNWDGNSNSCKELCPEGASCYTKAEVCPRTCFSNADCPSASYCSAKGMCSLYVELNGICDYGKKCAPGLSCSFKTTDRGICERSGNCASSIGCEMCVRRGCAFSQPGQPCADTCPQGFSCLTDFRKCPTGCVSDSDCLEGSCSAGACVPYSELGGLCRSGLACAPGLKCSYTSASGGICKIDGVCATSSTCSSCARRGCRWDGSVCTPGLTVCPAGVSCVSSRSQCPVGCTSNAACASGSFCSAGVCKPLLVLGQVCDSSSPCAAGLKCALKWGSQGVCEQGDGKCTSDADCFEAFCLAGRCNPFQGPNQMCSSSSSSLRCKSGLNCGYDAATTKYVCQLTNSYCQSAAHSGDCQSCARAGCFWSATTSTCGVACPIGSASSDCHTTTQTCPADRCSKKSSCVDCTLIGCQWAGSSSACSVKCPPNVACSSSPNKCSGQAPVLTAKIADLYLGRDNTVFHSFALAFSDPDSNNALRYNLEGLPANSGLSLDATNVALVGKPSAQDIVNSPISVSLSAVDSTGLSASATFKVFIGSCSQAPGCVECASMGCFFAKEQCFSICPFTTAEGGCTSTATSCPTSTGSNKNCDNDADCPTGQYCVTGQRVCSAKSSTGQKCNRLIPCAAGLQCELFSSDEGVCAPERCVSDSDCPVGGCVDGICAVGAVACDNSRPCPTSYRCVFTSATSGRCELEGGVNRAPVAQAIPAQTVKAGDFWNFPVGSFFSDPDNQRLQFTFTGQVPDTQLVLEPSSGVLFGNVGVAAAKATQPIVLTVTATDPVGLSVSTAVSLTVLGETNVPISSGAGLAGQACVDNSGCGKGLICGRARDMVGSVGVCISNDPARCSVAASCQDCAKTGCVWANGVCSSTCPGSGRECIRTSSECSAAVSNPCSNFPCPYPQTCIPNPSAASGGNSFTCVADDVCSKLTSCLQCSQSGCVWGASRCSRLCPPGVVCYKEPSRCPALGVCTSDADCLSKHFCMATTSAASGLPAGVTGVCAAYASEGQACNAVSALCSPPLVCSGSGFCQRPIGCDSNTQCPSGYFCQPPQLYRQGASTSTRSFSTERAEPRAGFDNTCQPFKQVGERCGATSAVWECAPGLTCDYSTDADQPTCRASSTSSGSGSSSSSTCCSAHGGKGCSDRTIEQCVCGKDPICCNKAYDVVCTEVAVYDCKASCPALTGSKPTAPTLAPPAIAPTPASSSQGSCCVAAGLVGCADKVVEQCVCAIDPFCCQTVWDKSCVNIAGTQCNSCSSSTTTTTNPAPTPASTTTTTTTTATTATVNGQDACCSTQNRGGVCSNVAVSTCMCKLDPYCCNLGWDSQCITLAKQQCSLQCDSAPSPAPVTPTATSSTMTSSPNSAAGAANSCCQVSGSSGCSDEGVQACVCKIDSYCCSGMWDQSCVNIGAQACNLACSSSSPISSSSSSTSSTSTSSTTTTTTMTTTTTAVGGGKHPCCAEGGSNFCSDKAVAACVCGLDSYCCTDKWDQLCISKASQCGLQC